MGERGRLAIVLAVTVFGMGFASCGDDSEPTAPAPGSGGGQEARSEPNPPKGEEQERRQAPARNGYGSPAEAPAEAHDDSGGGAEQFRVPGGDNSVQDFGAEADDSDLEQAAAALHAFLDARAADEWATACQYVSADIRRSLEQLGTRSEQLRGKGCPELFATLSGSATEQAREEAAVADVGAMRVEGDRGFLLYVGAEDVEYAIPMAREDDGWKVGALAGVPLS